LEGEEVLVPERDVKEEKGSFGGLLIMRVRDAYMHFCG